MSYSSTSTHTQQSCDNGKDTGLHCLVAIARFHRLPAEPEQLKHQFGRDEAPLNSQDILRAAKALGFRAQRTITSPERLRNQTLPAIGSDSNGHYFIIAKVTEADEEGRFLIQRMDRSAPETLNKQAFTALWSGELIRLALRSGKGQGHQPFNLAWFIPALVKYRKHFGEVLYAPVAGIVKELVLTAEGEVVTPAQPLMQIVPREEALVVEAYLANKDIGFVHERMPAAIKVHTFPFTKYGLIDAEVIQVSADALADEERRLIYKMRLLLQQDWLNVEGSQVDLLPGMAVTAEVTTGTRRLIEYFLAPLLRYRQESVRER